ncbi:hypothetical protein AB833_01140 [Chromatiales bacterium (ex Bugula neritina AB1)]|nr:hypothetical protein AB833_01140 [Chromatiales bacterium (ex Bugula neritina AB1)]
MTTLLTVLVLTAAVLHASWNALAKSGGAPEFSIAAYQLVGALICAPMLFLVPAPARESWPMIITSVLVHNIYYFTLARAYRSGDLSQVYPLFRGMAPVMVTTGAAVFAGEYLSSATVAGILIISVGLMSLTLMGRHLGAIPRAALGWGLATSVLIAIYTVVDGLGVRASGNSLSYILWLFTFEVVPIGCWLLITQRQRWFGYMRGSLATVVFGGIASSTAYGLVIIALGMGAMGLVSSLRETSVIFAAIIGSVFLREPFGRQRIIAAVVVASGIVLLKAFG